ncbi:hypothetical protein EG68_12436 [Paragonimus skrjabini miyazakii]|uniref:DMAP1-binding domain-containing protein n=1 Tax=Paragonimus skrjabini miyazakii TaxID=59628 RepID=A0A8S9YBY6_9TREM|nr:hypothetical protein EG68_12436 [Paragonimus skrjabini miyazakii]
MDNLDPSHLPFEVRSKLAELELELSEGDITEKGYQKKKSKLLAPFFRSRGKSPLHYIYVNSVLLHRVKPFHFAHKIGNV